MNANNTMENALKQAITAAVKKLEFKKYDVPEDNVVDCFLTDLFGILFPNNSGLVKERKKPGPKPKLDEHGNPIRSPRKSKKSPDGPAAAGAGEPVKERKKPGPKPKLDADGNPISKKAKAAGERKKPGPKPKLDADGNPVGKKAKKAAAKPLPPSPKASPKKAGAAKPNVEWSPNWTTEAKKVVKELGLELRLTPAKQKEIAAHLNAMAKSDFDAKKTKEHIRDFLRPTAAPPAPAAVAPPPPPPGGAAAAGDDSDGEEVELTEVEFKGKVYSVDTRDRKSMAVYDEAGTEHLGYVDSGEFVGMKVPVDDDAESESGSEDDE